MNGNAFNFEFKAHLRCDLLGENSELWCEQWYPKISYQLPDIMYLNT